MAFILHPRLAADCAAVLSLPLCRVLLMDDARFPWLILVPARKEVREIFDLDAADRAALMEEMSHAGQVLQRLTYAEKINIAALGNQVPQLHVHVIARFSTDPAWPDPVWCCTAAKYGYGEEEKASLVQRLQTAWGAV